ncbi:C4-dicarboxylate ABC transporter permease [Malaciobacter halophilus]|uniref:C4-dicarboxylate ABC transporter permease n=1 Tax=Malaciobacter halophilus TaxID=197482 RepID=A0A2N1J6F6_9BACT|nr:TRAP transporter small permease [Malaciobacter halophilus]AXH09361.1 TRAP transporter, small permease subunit [Malaciobacter halophilus]PKI82126.1 C4-dicarboxylate ABC transporter permease [Malaciobacter halophilus]
MEYYRKALKNFQVLLDLVDTGLSKIESILLATGVLLMAANTIINVIGRFVFDHSFFFSGELNRILIVLITFAGIGYAARHGRHIRMSALYDALPKKLRKVFMIFIALITSIIMFGLFYFSLAYIEKLIDSGRILPALQIPVYITYVWVPIGFFVTGVQYFLTVIKNLTQKDEVYLSTEVVDEYCEVDS